LRQVIRTGKGQMPAFGGLMGDEDLSHVITFIRSLPPRALPAPSPASVPEMAPELAPNGGPAPSSALSHVLGSEGAGAK
jgi:mono/diheme cytochrome c family protein